MPAWALLFLAILPGIAGANESFEWVSFDPHVHTKEKGVEDCPDAKNPISKLEMRHFGRQHGLQLLVDNYWGPRRPNSEERSRFPLPFSARRTRNESLHGNNHRLKVARHKGSGLPLASNLVDGLEISWFLADRGGHMGVFGARSLDWFFADDGSDKPKTGIDALDALRTDPESRSRHFVALYHLDQWNPTGYPQVASVDYGRPFELPVTVAFEEWGVKGLETEGPHISENSGDYMAGSPIDTGTFDALVKLTNSGFRMSLLGGSDYSCLGPDDPRGPPGNGLGKKAVLRTFLNARRDASGHITYQSVLDAAKAGRTIVARAGTVRPRLGRFELRYGKERARIGEALKVSGQVLPITVTAANLPFKAEVLVNGGPAIRNARGELIRPLTGGARRIGNGNIQLNQSAWIVAQIDSEITSPIYVEINEQPLRVSAEDPCYFIGHIERAKQELQKAPRGDLNISEYPEERKPYLLKKYAEAQDIYAERFQEAKALHGGPALEKCFVPVD